MKLHIEGMGIIGSLLALKLESEGVEFTWNDIEAPISAWPASTGCIYPSGDAFDMQNYDFWLAGFLGAMPEVELATYCFLSKHPPHGGKYKFERNGVFGVAEMPSLHLNAQRLVPRVRRQFQEARLTSAPKHAQIVVSHGFGQRLDHFMWGWTAQVQLSHPEGLKAPPRCSYYMRVGRFKLAYAYPTPGELWYYAGSSLITQKVAHPLEIAPKFKRWQEHVLEYTGMRVLRTGRYAAGWRPVAAPDDNKLLRAMNGRWVLKPLWSSGIRHAPAVVQAVLDKL